MSPEELKIQKIGKEIEGYEKRITKKQIDFIELSEKANEIEKKIQERSISICNDIDILEKKIAEKKEEIGIYVEKQNLIDKGYDFKKDLIPIPPVGSILKRIKPTKCFAKYIGVSMKNETDSDNEFTTKYYMFEGFNVSYDAMPKMFEHKDGRYIIATDSEIEEQKRLCENYRDLRRTVFLKSPLMAI